MLQRSQNYVEHNNSAYRQGPTVTIELNRRFVEYRDEQTSDPDVIARFGRNEGTLSWDDLLSRRRAVILAEAGSGKTTEMQAQARQQANRGRLAFYARLEDVGRSGLEAALKPSNRALLANWRASDQDAWCFINSVDEAKDAGVKLPTALRAIALAISGAERRAHVILSGRYTDWQFRADLTHLNAELAIPADQTLPPPPTPDQLVVSTIHHETERPVEQATEAPVIVVMSGLDEERIRLFAVGKELPRLDGFIEQIKSSNLWQFARRPLDLDWLAEFWRNNDRLGTLAEMLERCIAERLQESNVDRSRVDNLDRDRAGRAVERIAAAMIFCRKNTILVPDTAISLTNAGTEPFDVAEILTDWSPQDCIRLLGRAVFDPATMGRVRFHNDNTDVVRSYLAARFLERLRQTNLSKQGLIDLLFADTYGVAVIKPSMQEVAAWLSLWDDSILGEVVRRDPFLLLTAGDPEGLPPHARERLLAAAVERIVAGDRVPLLDFDTLKRFCRPDLADITKRLWQLHHENVEVRKFLLRVIWLGGIKACAELPVEVAFDPATNSDLAVYAGRALIATADDAVKRRYANYVRDSSDRLKTTIVWDVLEGLFPNFIAVADLISILAKIDVSDREGGLGLDWYGPKLVERINSSQELSMLLEALLTQLGGKVRAIDREDNDRERAYFPVIAASAHRLLMLSPVDETPASAIDALVRLGESARRSSFARTGKEDLVAELQRSPSRRRAAFCALWSVTQTIRCSAGGPSRIFGRCKCSDGRSFSQPKT